MITEDPELFAAEIKAIGLQLSDILFRHMGQPKELSLQDAAIDGRGEDHEREIRVVFTLTLSKPSLEDAEMIIAEISKQNPGVQIFKGKIKKPQ